MKRETVKAPKPTKMAQTPSYEKRAFPPLRIDGADQEGAYVGYRWRITEILGSKCRTGSVTLGSPAGGPDSDIFVVIAGMVRKIPTTKEGYESDSYRFFAYRGVGADQWFVIAGCQHTTFDRYYDRVNTRQKRRRYWKLNETTDRRNYVEVPGWAKQTEIVLDDLMDRCIAYDKKMGKC